MGKQLIPSVISVREIWSCIFKPDILVLREESRDPSKRQKKNTERDKYE